MPPGEVGELEVAGVTLAYFARTYPDERSSAAAYERARKKIRAQDNTSVFRFVQPEAGGHVIAVLSRGRAEAARVLERVAWGGDPYRPSEDELAALGSRFREVAEAGQLRSSTNWAGVGGLGVDAGGSRGPMRRPKG